VGGKNRRKEDDISTRKAIQKSYTSLKNGGGEKKEEKRGWEGGAIFVDEVKRPAP